MPAAATKNLDAERAERLAALWARFDTGNPNDAEAMNAGRAIRRMLAPDGLRLVDVLELPEVRRALDVQLQPVRHENAELIEARKKAEEWRDEVTQRMQQVKQLAELLAAEKELTGELRQQVAGAARAPSRGKQQPLAKPQNLPVYGHLLPMYEGWGGVLATLVTVTIAVLWLAAAFSHDMKPAPVAVAATPPPQPEILKGAKRSGLAKTKRGRGALVRKNRRVLFPAKPADVSRGLHRRE